MDKNKILSRYEHESLEKKFLDEEENCILCGEKLMFVHISNFIHNLIEEEASCTSCGIKNKKQQHSLQ